VTQVEVRRRGAHGDHKVRLRPVVAVAQEVDERARLLGRPGTLGVERGFVEHHGLRRELRQLGAKSGSDGVERREVTPERVQDEDVLRRRLDERRKQREHAAEPHAPGKRLHWASGISPARSCLTTARILFSIWM
jgi:hypothetical protein